MMCPCHHGILHVNEKGTYSQGPLMPVNVVVQSANLVTGLCLLDHQNVHYTFFSVTTDSYFLDTSNFVMPKSPAETDCMTLIQGLGLWCLKHLPFLKICFMILRSAYSNCYAMVCKTSK